MKIILQPEAKTISNRELVENQKDPSDSTLVLNPTFQRTMIV